MGMDLSSLKNMRDVFVQTLIEMAEKDDRVVFLDADLAHSVGTMAFQEKFPNRYFNIGISEQDMVGTAGGLSSQGFIPFAHTFTPFATRRDYDQWYLSANYAQQNVKLVGSDPGITAQLNGGTHMEFGDLAIMRTTPGAVIVEPSDSYSCYHLLHAVKDHKGSVYFRMHRKGTNIVYSPSDSFEIGKAHTLGTGSDVTIVALGLVMVKNALEAVQTLKGEGISATLIDALSLKPLDEQTILASAKKTGAVLTCENAQKRGGLGGAVAELLCREAPMPMLSVGVDDQFGQVGPFSYLEKFYHLTASDIVSEAKKVVALKG